MRDLLIRRDNTFGTPEEDAFRRDFTVNALFYDIATYSVIDYVGGLDDLQARVIRCIGDPDVRFREDPVRMLRAIVLAARHGNATYGGVLYATLRPCFGCAKESIQAGIHEVVFDEPYQYEASLEEAYRRLIAESGMRLRQHRSR